MNIKTLLVIITGAIAPLAFALPAYACLMAGSCFGDTQQGFVSALDVMMADIIIFLKIAFDISLLYLVFGIIKRVRSGKDKTERKQAKKHIIRATTSLVITILAFILAELGYLFLGGPSYWPLL